MAARSLTLLKKEDDIGLEGIGLEKFVDEKDMQPDQIINSCSIIKALNYESSQNSNECDWSQYIYHSKNMKIIKASQQSRIPI